MATVGSFKSLYSRRKLASVYGLYQLEMSLVCVYGPESWTIQQRIRENWRKIFVNTFMDLLSVALTRKQKGLYRRGTYLGTECGLKNGIQIFKIYIFIGCFFCIAPYMQQPALITPPMVCCMYKCIINVGGCAYWVKLLTVFNCLRIKWLNNGELQIVSDF